MTKTLASVLAPIVLFASTPTAQVPKDIRPRFDVTSVKPNTSGDPSSSFNFFPGSRLVVVNTSVRFLLRSAYLIQDSRMIGLPEWATSDRFDINAKTSSDLPPTHPFGPAGPRQLILQTLLADRFNLATHTETRELPVLALVRARADGRLGPKIVKWDGECPDADAVLRGARRCGSNFAFGTGVVRLAGRAPMQVFSDALGFLTEKIVVDRTNLSGAYDIDLNYSRVQTPDSSDPSLYTALQEQLGLKLESTRAPVEVLVIDHIERPLPD